MNVFPKLPELQNGHASGETVCPFCISGDIFYQSNMFNLNVYHSL